MNSKLKDILSFIESNNIKFVKLAFTDIYGNLKNISIMSNEFSDAVQKGVSINSSAFSEAYSEVILVPDITGSAILTPQFKTEKTIKFFCNIKHINGKNCKIDLRNQLSSYVSQLREVGYDCKISSQSEFYLFETDENGNPTKTPHDKAGYMDPPPLDKCENTRREICLALENMGIGTKSLCHSYGHGQNVIEFKNADPLTLADNMICYKAAVKDIAARKNLFASFMPKPLEDQWGSRFNIGFSIEKKGKNIFTPDNETGKRFIAGILNRIKEITCFLNPVTNSYKRLCKNYAPVYINGDIVSLPPLIKISPTGDGEITVCSPDGTCNPYIAFMLLLRAGFEGIENKLSIDETKSEAFRLPDSLEKAVNIAKTSQFVKESLSDEIFFMLFKYFDDMLSRYKIFDEKMNFEEEFYFSVY